MSLVTFLGIYFVREAGIALATVGAAFFCENLLRGLLAPFFGALSDRTGRRPLILGASLLTAAVLPCFSSCKARLRFLPGASRWASPAP
jgi:Na+/melibiose symporter-like transporter